MRNVFVVIFLPALFFGLCLLPSCNTNNDGDDGGDADEGGGIGENPRTSECGGFGADLTKAGDDDTSDDCGDERLLWTYDAATRTVSFVHEKLELNCCGEHSIEVIYADGVYEIAETDGPVILENGETARCACGCLFDFAIDLAGVVATIQVKITLDVTDDDDPRTARWEGEIDLSQGSGDILVRENVGWCE